VGRRRSAVKSALTRLAPWLQPQKRMLQFEACPSSLGPDPRQLRRSRKGSALFAWPGCCYQPVKLPSEQCPCPLPLQFWSQAPLSSAPFGYCSSGPIIDGTEGRPSLVIARVERGGRIVVCRQRRYRRINIAARVKTSTASAAMTACAGLPGSSSFVIASAAGPLLPA
jgi:hypothetical protein